MTQLILDVDEYNLTLPESKDGGYRAEREPLSQEVEMITGRVVKEVRGNVWRINYQYGYFDDATKNQIIAACEKGKREPIRCAFLPPESRGPLTYSSFFVITFRYPKFEWSRNGAPIWADFGISLREVEPSD